MRTLWAVVMPRSMPSSRRSATGASSWSRRTCRACSGCPTATAPRSRRARASDGSHTCRVNWASLTRAWPTFLIRALRGRTRGGKQTFEAPRRHHDGGTSLSDFLASPRTSRGTHPTRGLRADQAPKAPTCDTAGCATLLADTGQLQRPRIRSVDPLVRIRQVWRIPDGSAAAPAMQRVK
jgi:hypothetical protein